MFNSLWLVALQRMNLNCGRNLVAKTCLPISTRDISTTSSALVFKGKPRTPRFNTKKGRKAHWTLNKEKFKEPIQAQKIRTPWGWLLNCFAVMIFAALMLYINFKLPYSPAKHRPGVHSNGFCLVIAIQNFETP